MLREKLPTEVSPPKMSIFWSVPWYNNPVELKEVTNQIMRHMLQESGRDRYLSSEEFERLIRNPEDYEELSVRVKKYIDENETLFSITGFGREPNQARARKIRYKDEDIKVFPHEFSIISHENMKLYVQGDESGECSHELVTTDVAEETLLKEVTEGELKPILEAAQLDGCTLAQAILVALGMDISLPDSEFPPLGWYRVKKEYGLVYCSHHDLEETDHRGEALEKPKKRGKRSCRKV